ncbi:uncharacterized protein B0T15DRAFT_320730 [Chaetomium strumarium]|uniref:DUF7719 domain-containing protein n=1 Tax=Chaetomium strumarium TaxID=1170767 RepID=A0AAJ0LXW7_9PEZI|nr:hypothetical protein B0T15DRAFT_320730 [Chaetomium strumarium]
MARKRKQKTESNGIELKEPDWSGPTEKTLLQLAEEKGLFGQAETREAEIEKKAVPATIPRTTEDVEDDDAKLPPTVERVLETFLWTVSLSMLHFTLDVLVHNQYSVDRIVWPRIWMRFGQALLVFGLLIYVLHPHAANPGLVPGLGPRYQSAVRQVIFFTMSVLAGCYVIHITNTFGYMAVMKQAPPVGCLWVWSVIELELPWAVLSLAGAGMFLWQNGYTIK